MSRTLPGTETEITSVHAMNMTVVTFRRVMLIMAMVTPAITSTEAMSSMVIAKDMGMRLSAQSVIIRTVRWQTIIWDSLTMQNLKSLRKARHMRKVTTSITGQMNTGTETVMTAAVRLFYFEISLCQVLGACVAAERQKLFVVG